MRCGVSGCGYLALPKSSFCEVHRPPVINIANTSQKDTINPDHYKTGGIEVIDFMQAKLTKEQFEGFLVGNALKYLSRYQHKNGIEDIKKAEWYVTKLKQTLEQKS